MRNQTQRPPLLNLIFLASMLFTTALIGSAAADADSLDLSQYRGKVVLVDFWASWCAPCRRSFPWLNNLQAKYADRGLVVIGVNVDREHVDAERFLHEVPALFPIVYDPSGALASTYDVPGMPTSFVFGPDGKLIGKHVGFTQSSRAEREAQLQQLLPSSSGSH